MNEGPVLYQCLCWGVPCCRGCRHEDVSRELKLLERKRDVAFALCCIYIYGWKVSNLNAVPCARFALGRR